MIGGRYTLRAAVGHGGMGTVWRAADTLLRRDVAVKEVISPPGLAPSDRDAMYERTLREARAAAALSHPSVVQVYDVVTENGRPWIVMELLDARSLADMVIEDGPLAPRAVAKIGIAMLGALEVAHAAGVLHRDVKPANVLIASDGRCVLTDFGVARMPTDVQLTTPGMVLGSPHFISPERAMGGPFGPPSDLFSLGVTLYTAVEGRPPFDKGDPIETMHAVVEDPPAPMVRCGPLTNVLYGLLEKDPSRRFDVATARAMLRELLAGPLASQAPAHMMTDPYAIVPAQRTSRPTPPVAPAPAAASAQPTGKIGGRAMLAPGESLTDRLKQLKAGADASAGRAPTEAGESGGASPAAAGTTRSASSSAALDETSPNLGAQPWDVPTGASAAARPDATARSGALAAARADATASAHAAISADTTRPINGMPAVAPTSADSDTTRPINARSTPYPGAGSTARPVDAVAADVTRPINSASTSPVASAADATQPINGMASGYPGGVAAAVYSPGLANGAAMAYPPNGVPHAAATAYPSNDMANGYPPLGANPAYPTNAAYPGNGMGAAYPNAGYPGAAGSPSPSGRGRALGTLRRAGDQLVATVRGWSRATRIAVAAGVGVVLLAGTVMLASGDDKGGTISSPADPGSVAARQAVPTQRFNDRGVALNVPKDWRRAETSRYVDFTEPDGSGRRVRILMENATADPTRFMEIAENGLKARTKSCAKPYARVALREVELAGRLAAELEYTCGEGDTMRHGIWRAIVTGGKAHSFYLTTPEVRFAESQPIFTEMVNSFELAS